MSTWLRQSTAVDVMIGPELDSVDGNTVESGLTITQPDIRLSKNGGAFAQKSAAQTLVHAENGWYPANLSTTDTGTLGSLLVVVHEAGALQAWREFMVVTQQAWDSLFGSDVLQVDLTQLQGTAIASPTIAGVIEADITHWRGSVPSILSSGNVQTLLSGVGSGAFTNDGFANDTGLKSIRSGTAQDGANGSITLDAGASSVNDFYKGNRIYLTNGTGAGQSRLCTGYNGTTKVAIIEPNWITNPAAAATTFAIREDASSLTIATGGIAPTSFAAGAINAAAIAAGAIDDDAVAADMDAYHAKVWVVKESTTTDHYGVAFFKNGQPVTTGITSPTIQVIKASDGTDLIASGALTEIGALGIYKKDESTNKMTGGQMYFAKVQATIDGSARVWLQQIGRDSA